MLTSDAVKDQARALGFDLCGIAPATGHPELAYLREWLDRGYAGSMDYLVRSAAQRADVREIVPGARCVIVTGTNYYTGSPEVEAGSDGETGGGQAGIARIARYAQGDDYHDVLQARMDALLAWMRQQSAEPFQACAYVDTGPVQERVYAQYAGIGWIGKNTCLINAEVGSWLYLAEIICTLPLATDAEGLEQCGTCMRCIQACPTNALVEPFVLDATRCLSYLTIESPDAIPEAYRDALGQYVYGCDICQDVCPYNQAPPRSQDAAWQTRPGFDLPRLVELWQQTDRDLQQLTKGSAMRRAKVAGLRRNIAVAIGNSGDPDAVAALAVDIADRPTADDPLVQEHVEWALERGARMLERD